MRMFLVFLVYAAASLSPIGHDAPKGDLAKLQGTWKGEHLGPAKNRTFLMTVSEGAFTWTHIREGDGVETAKIKGLIHLDESSEPRKIDFQITDDLLNGRDLPDVLGVYKVDGDELIFRFGRDRPAGFKEDDRNQVRLKRQSD